MPRRKTAAETAHKTHSSGQRAAPEINPEEIAQLKRLINEEEDSIERQLRRDMADITRHRERKISHEIKHLEQRNKQLIMWIGVVSLMTVVVVFWLANLQATARRLAVTAAGPQINIAETKESLTKTMEKVIQGLNDLQTQSQVLDSASSSTSSAATSSANVFGQ